MSDRIFIFDTTLRDGEQSPGATMNTREKVLLARQLESLGVDIIQNCEVTGFKIENGKVLGVETSRGYIGAKKVASFELLALGHFWTVCKYTIFNVLFDTSTDQNQFPVLNSI